MGLRGGREHLKPSLVSVEMRPLRTLMAPSPGHDGWNKEKQHVGLPAMLSLAWMLSLA